MTIMKKKMITTILLTFSLFYLLSSGSQFLYSNWMNNTKLNNTNNFFLRIIRPIDEREISLNIPKNGNSKKEEVTSKKNEISYLLDGYGYGKSDAKLMDIINSLIYVIQKSLVWIAAAVTIFIIIRWTKNRRGNKKIVPAYKKNSDISLNSIKNDEIDSSQQKMNELNVSSNIRKVIIDFNDQLPKKFRRKSTETLNQWSERLNLHLDFDIYKKVRYGEKEEMTIESEEIERLETELYEYLQGIKGEQEYKSLN